MPGVVMQHREGSTRHPQKQQLSRETVRLLRGLASDGLETIKLRLRVLRYILPCDRACCGCVAVWCCVCGTITTKDVLFGKTAVTHWQVKVGGASLICMDNAYFLYVTLCFQPATRCTRQ